MLSGPVSGCITTGAKRKELPGGCTGVLAVTPWDNTVASKLPECDHGLAWKENEKGN